MKNQLKYFNLIIVALSALFLISNQITFVQANNNYNNNQNNNQHQSDDRKDEHNDNHNQNNDDKHEGRHNDDKKCFKNCRPSITPVPAQTVCPTSSPIPSPTTEPEVTPTNTPSPTSNPTPTETTTPLPTPTSGSSNSNGGSGGSGSYSPPVCNDSKPGTPTNLQVKRVSSTSVLLAWNQVSTPNSYYLIAYGPDKTNFPYGNPNVGNGNNYTVSALSPNQNYCFYVQAQNGCTPGDRSDVVCLTSTSLTTNVLGASIKYNPLIEGIKNTYSGDVLGATTIPKTAQNTYSTTTLPTNNTQVVGNISIDSLKINSPVYASQTIGSMPAVGYKEILKTVIGQSIVYYAHNANDLFGQLYTLKDGAKILVQNETGPLQYRVVSKNYISATDSQFFDVPQPNVIYLLTCSFTHPEQRIVIKAEKI